MHRVEFSANQGLISKWRQQSLLWTKENPRYLILLHLMHVEIRAQRKAVRSHKPIFWIQMQIIKGWWIFTSSSESPSTVFITGAFAILILGEKKGQKATQVHSYGQLGAQDLWWHNTEDGKSSMRGNLTGQVWGESWTHSSIKPHFAHPVQNTVGKIKQSSLCSQDKVAQVSSELQTSNKFIFPPQKEVNAPSLVQLASLQSSPWPFVQPVQ